MASEELASLRLEHHEAEGKMESTACQIEYRRRIIDDPHTRLSEGMASQTELETLNKLLIKYFFAARNLGKKLRDAESK